MLFEELRLRLAVEAHDWRSGDAVYEDGERALMDLRRATQSGDPDSVILVKTLFRLEAVGMEEDIPSGQLFCRDYPLNRGRLACMAL